MLPGSNCQAVMICKAIKWAVTPPYPAPPIHVHRRPVLQTTSHGGTSHPFPELRAWSTVGANRHLLNDFISNQRKPLVGPHSTDLILEGDKALRYS